MSFNLPERSCLSGSIRLFCFTPVSPSEKGMTVHLRLDLEFSPPMMLHAQFDLVGPMVDGI